MKEARRGIMEQNQQKKVHMSKINGYEYKVAEDVFSPDSFFSTGFIIPHIPRLGGTIVEVGTGCGTLVLDSILSGKFEKGIAGDIYEGAVVNAK